MPRTAAVLIVAASGRALAASAHRGGFVPLGADFFGDQDTIAVGAAHVRLCGGLQHGMRRDNILPALESLAARREPTGIVCGTGFEDRPELISSIARRWKLLGNPSGAVARAKAPLGLSKLCCGNGIAHPELSFSPPSEPANWLRTRKGRAVVHDIRNGVREGSIVALGSMVAMPVAAPSTTSAGSMARRHPPSSSPTRVVH